jgi:hypothetical protein
MKRNHLALLILSLSVLILGVGGAVGSERHVTATLSPVNGSGISGRIQLTAMPHGGTLIAGNITGLTPGTQYLSLYYENHTCELEPYSQDDVISRYAGNSQGRAVFAKKLGDDLDEINSVSVRLASDFSLKACADVHP